jgi:hypothetical protein
MVELIAMDQLAPEVEDALREATTHIEALHAQLLADYPALKGSMAIPGMFIGHGLGYFVARGLTDEQIVKHVMTIVDEIRVQLARLQADV